MNQSWELVNLGEVLELSIDAVEIEPSESYPIAGVYSFGRGLFSRSPLWGTETTYKVFHRLHKDSLVLSQLKAWEGALAIVPESFDGWFLSPQFPTFKAIPNRLDINYLVWYCKQPKVWEQLRNKSRGMGARRDSVSPKKFLSLNIPLPPLEEQRRIVAKVDELAGKIEEARSLREQSIKETQAVINSSGRKILSSVKADLTRFKDWLDDERGGIQTGPFGAQLGSIDYIDSGIPVLTIGNVQFDGLHTQNLKYVNEHKAEQLTRYQVKEGDILFARMGTVGRCCVVPKETEDWLINYHIIRVAPDPTFVESRYLHWIIRASQEVEEYLEEKIRGATRKGVNSKIVGGLPCRIPSLPEQQRIVAYLDRLQSKVDEMKRLREQSLQELDALLPSILDKAFKGEL